MATDYQDVWTGVELYQNGSDIWMYRNGNSDRTKLNRSNIVHNLRDHEIDPDTKIDPKDIIIPAASPVWRLSRAPRYNAITKTFNTYTPTRYLKMQPGSYIASLPKQVDILLRNLAGGQSLVQLINVLAYFFQTLEKPLITILMVGPPGTGKNTFAELMGKLLGDYAVVTQNTLRNQYNSYLKAPVILLNELNASPKQSQLLKTLTDETTVVNEKYKAQTTCHLNNLVLIASNMRGGNVPMQIEHDDRRVLALEGGAGLNLGKDGHTVGWDRDALWTELDDFAQFLLNSAVNPGDVQHPIMTDTKTRIIELSMDPIERAVCDWLKSRESEDSEDAAPVVELVDDIKRHQPQLKRKVTIAKATEICRKYGHTIVKLEDRRPAIKGMMSKYFF